MTGDGLLVRVHPPGGVLTAEQALAIADAAEACGNGHLNGTGRGNLQIRGVTDATYPALVAVLKAIGLAEPESGGPPWPIIVSPFRGLDPRDRLDSRALAEAVESEVRALGGLPDKVAVAVDGGGAFALDHVGADLLLVAVGTDTGPAVAVGVATPAGHLWIGTAPAEKVPASVRALLAGFGQMLGQGRTQVRRICDLEPALRSELALAATLGGVMVPPERPSVRQAGLIEQSDGHAALLVGLPFGQCAFAQLAAVAVLAARFGNGEVRPSFTRGLLLPGIALENTERVRDAVRRAGLIVDVDDPWLGLKACPGAPACGSAHTPAPEDAARLAQAAISLLRTGATIHVSACAKGCAHPGRADLTLIGSPDGAYAVVVGGGTRDAPTARLPIEQISARLRRLETCGDLDRVFGKAAP